MSCSPRPTPRSSPMARGAAFHQPLARRRGRSARPRPHRALPSRRLPAGLGHRLIKSHPDSGGGEFDEREEVSVVFFIAGGNGSEVFEFVEETLDDVAITVEKAAEGRDVRSEEHTSELQSLMRITYA